MPDVLVACLDEENVFLMPAGGPRAVRHLVEHLRAHRFALGSADEVDPWSLYPDAECELEALMLATLARAASPLAIDLLLRQPTVSHSQREITAADRERSRRLNRLIDPPLVVVVGPPNCGKSTLSNRLLGRTLSIAADMPGTTRDYTAARVNVGGLVVNWVDTPGLRDSEEEIEQRAIAVARRLIDTADLVIALTDPFEPWPALAREPGLRVANKRDLAVRPDAEVCISALTGEGVDQLVEVVRERLVHQSDLEATGPWLFDERVESLIN